MSKDKNTFERGFIMTRAELKNEAIKRCEILKEKGAFKQSVNQFIKSDKVSVSEPPSGAFYWLRVVRCVMFITKIVLNLVNLVQ